MRRILIIACILSVAAALIFVHARFAIAQDIQNALVVFAEAGDLERVRHLVIMKGAKPNSRDLLGRIAIHEAAAGGHLPVIKFLIEQGADVNIRVSMGYTPLMKAIDAGHLEIVKYLGLKGADLGLRDSFGNLPIDLAEKGPNRAVYDLLRPVYAEFELTEELLQSAAKGRLSSVRQIVSAGMPVNKQSEDGLTALIAASGFGQLKVVKWLVEHKADLDLASADGATALYVAVKNNHKKVVEYLIDGGARVRPYGKKVSSVIRAAEITGNPAITKLIAEKQGQEERESKYSDDYLEAYRNRDKYRASAGGTLTDAQVNEVIHATDALLATKSQWLGDLGKMSFGPINLRIIIADRDYPSIGSDNEPTATGSAVPLTPLMRVIANWKADEAELLINTGADVNERNGIGETALIVFAQTSIPFSDKEKIRPTFDGARLLIERKVDVNSVDVAGWTALMWAVFNENVDLAKFLLQQGANPALVSKSGPTALSIAEKLSNQELLHALTDQVPR